MNCHDPIHIFRDPADPNAVIVFFHDIYWGREDDKLYKSSWMSCSGECWPETWLSDKYPEAQILSTCYDSGIWKGKTTGKMDLYKLGENLRQDILSTYRATNCPIFLIGHGLGGLVIKALIKEMQDKRDALARREELQNDTNLRQLDYFLKNVKGILYYNTPFLGSKLATLTRCLPCRGLLLSHLELLSTQACRLNYWFSRWQADQLCKTKMIWAGCPTKVGLWYGHLVEEASARFDIDDFYVVGESDHYHICMPRDKIDFRYNGLIELIRGVMSEKNSGPLPLTEDSKKCDAANSVKKILDRLRTLKRGEGLQLNKDVLRNIMRFEDLWGNLSDALKDSRLEMRCVDASSEHWEPFAGELREDVSSYNSN